MVGSAAIAALIAQVAFWTLIVYGSVAGELRAKGVTVFLLLWLSGRVGLPHVAYGAATFPSFVAILDIALVFAIFKGDVRLT